MIGFAGLSHLGIVSSVASAAKGEAVLAFDPDAARCETLAQGTLPITEPGLPQLWADARARVRLTSDPRDLQACPLVIISADVPTSAENRSDLSAIQQLLETVAAHAVDGTVLVLLSQVPPGFTRAAAQRLRPGLTLLYQVETLVFGQAVERALAPERLIVGCRDPRQPLPQAYAAWAARFACPVLAMRYESAELAKIAINLFLTSCVTTTNTLAALCEAIGADWAEIAPSLRLDRRIGPHAYLTPGLGLSGGNLERDLMTVDTLARAHGTDAGIVDAWLDHSRSRRDWVLRQLHAEVLSQVPQPLIAVWGLAYKPQTHSMKNAPALALLEALRGIPVRAYDPAARLEISAWPSVTQVSSALEACDGADALAVMTPWPEFAAVDLAHAQARMRHRALIDPFGAIDQARSEALGFRYARLGTPALAIGDGVAVC